MNADNGTLTAWQAVTDRGNPPNESSGVVGRLLILPSVLLISDVFIWHRAANLLRIRATPTEQLIDSAINSQQCWVSLNPHHSVSPGQASQMTERSAWPPNNHCPPGCLWLRPPVFDIYCLFLISRCNHSAVHGTDIDHRLNVCDWTRLYSIM